MDIHIWISIYWYPYKDIHIWISRYGYPYMDITTYMLFGHETSFILRYQYVDKMNRIRKQFSIEWYGQNKVLYGPKHGLYRKNLCQTLFRHETSFPSSKIHQSGTIWIGKPFSIDLNHQNQVPIGPYEGFYRNFEIFDKKSKKKISFFFYCSGGVFRSIGRF